ncbi:hypothetical protein P152DRAFT_449009 [Eremomyces bilateralis CBS 781.70]|uniref:Uncharacterized protein n=1 Tax=Eremomyces bilateralis CBS 781.70 TaxID=1392243 RepID=A0A6G1G4F7_9PEZI|nr:uncharacterized protein P152DRAFT_449009 [Eremomyces bilateralis CBS 781.70]KAF1812908.1 hypothetical protein P152DRAFT_449009 [Eremomyces bilateralis CBS 781.70]
MSTQPRNTTKMVFDDHNVIYLPSTEGSNTNTESTDRNALFVRNTDDDDSAERPGGALSEEPITCSVFRMLLGKPTDLPTTTQSGVNGGILDEDCLIELLDEVNAGRLANGKNPVEYLSVTKQMTGQPGPKKRISLLGTLEPTTHGTPATPSYLPTPKSATAPAKPKTSHPPKNATEKSKPGPKPDKKKLNPIKGSGHKTAK